MSKNNFRSYKLELSSFGIRAIIKSHARICLTLEKLLSHRDSARISMNLLNVQSDANIISELNVLAERDYFSGKALFINLDAKTSDLARSIAQRLEAKCGQPYMMKHIVFVALLAPMSCDDFEIHAAAAAIEDVDDSHLE